MNEARLDALLRDVAPEIEYPPTPQIAAAVAHRIAHDPLAPRALLPRPWLRPALVAAALVILVGFFSLAFSPTARRAVADLLGVVGIRITFGAEPEIHENLPAPNPGELDLGERVHLTKALRILGFQPKVLDLPNGESFIDRSIGDTGMHSIYYEDHGILLTQFLASVDEGFFKKVSTEGARVRFTPVGDATGYWVSGDPHVFYYVDANGDFREEDVRLAGNVLLWEEDGITYRIEGAETLSEALDLIGWI